MVRLQEQLLHGKKTNRCIQIGFVLSLILNGFLVGFVMGGPHGLFGPPPMPDPVKRLYEAAEQISPDIRGTVIGILDRRTPEINTNMRDGMEGFKEIREALTAKDLHLEELDAIFGNMAKHHEKMGLSLGNMCKEIASAIPNFQDRAKFFELALPPEPPFRGPPPK